MPKFYLLLIIGITTLIIQCQNIDNCQSIDNYLNSIHNEKNLNGNVLIVHNDSIIYNNSFGFSNSEKTEKLSVDHLFGLGSVNKEFPAVAIMQLEEKGLLSIEDNLSAHIDNLPVWAEEIKIKNLLDYSSGLPRIDWKLYFQSDKGVNQNEIVNDLINLQELEANPGSKYIYSNYNPLLLIKIVERISGITFSEYLQEKIFRPYQITGIKIENKFPFESDNLFAFPFDENFEKDIEEYELTTICATVLGISQWIRKLDNFNIISRASIKKLSLKFEDDAQISLGDCDWKDNKLKFHEHHGSTGNYECLISNSKEENFTIILLTNQKNKNLFTIKNKLVDMIKLNDGSR